MRRYRCYFLDENAVVSAWRALEHHSPEAACNHALGLQVGHSTAVAVELWEGADLTFRYSRLETSQTATELRRLCAFALAAAELEADLSQKRAIGWGAARLASEAEALERQELS